jgi:hypothetical protein
MPVQMINGRLYYASERRRTYAPPPSQNLFCEMLDDSLLSLIGSHLRVRDLGRLAQTCSRLGGIPDRRCARADELSVVDEAARLAVENLPAHLHSRCPRLPSVGWLNVLGELERANQPLAFTLASTDCYHASQKPGGAGLYAVSNPYRRPALSNEV